MNNIVRTCRICGSTHLCKEFSEREEEVLQLLSQGYTNRNIALTLCISIKTVETYTLRIQKRLGLKSLYELVVYAVKRYYKEEGNSKDSAVMH